MTAKGYFTAARARGLAIALLVNAAILGLLAIGPQAKLHLQPEVPSTIVVLELYRPHPLKVIEPERTPQTKPAAQAPLSSDPRPHPLEHTAPAAAPPAAGGRPAAQPPPTATVPPSAPSATVPVGSAGQGAAPDKGAAAMRHLLGCAAFSSGRRRDGEDCEGHHGDLGHIDPLSPEKRFGLGLSGSTEREEIEATSRELHKETFVPRGSYFRYGCNSKDGKFKCSTY